MGGHLLSPTGDADLDFPVGTQPGYLFNPRSKEKKDSLPGKAGEDVKAACQVADRCRKVPHKCVALTALLTDGSRLANILWFRERYRVTRILLCHS